MATAQPLRSSPTGGPLAAGYLGARPLVLSLAKLLMLALSYLPSVQSHPMPWGIVPAFVTASSSASSKHPPPPPANSPRLWINLIIAAALILIGGAFAGLTIALMGQDEIYLQVIKTSGEPHERKHATSVLKLLKKGKHWVLVTLLLGNVITNETLPIVLDRTLGGGWPAVLGSTASIVIFGEIIPQSVCVRYGLPIGAWMTPFVLVLMWILGPVAWPTAKLLDKLLGEDHGTTYKKAGLKTLVTLHKSLGAAGEQLNQDEVTIISAVLDLKAKPVGDIMTPMANVFTMSADTVLDEDTMEDILGAGYSRIPIYSPDNPENFVGMLLVKMLITYDPEDCKRVRDFALATLPETRAETSCLDIVNFFQEGKSHMVLVSEYPGDDHGSLGVVTLEDVIEELIGEEIIDESDVFIDVQKAIRRMTPAPKYRVPKGAIVTETEDKLGNGHVKLLDGDFENENSRTKADGENEGTTESKPNGIHFEQNVLHKAKSATLRRTSSAKDFDKEGAKSRHVNPGLKETFKHLGPSNLASRPRSTRYNTVKIKPGASSFSESAKNSDQTETLRRGSSHATHGAVGAGVVHSGGKDASDGILALQAGYGTMSPTGSRRSRSRRDSFGTKTSEDVRHARALAGGIDSRPHSQHRSRSASQSTLGSLESIDDNKASTRRRAKGVARSGSITENIIEQGGIRKTVLELTSSSSDLETPQAQETTNSGRKKGKNRDGSRDSSGDDNDDDEGKENEQSKGSSGRKKRRRKRRKQAGGAGTSNDGEGEPLLGKGDGD